VLDIASFFFGTFGTYLFNSVKTSLSQLPEAIQKEILQIAEIKKDVAKPEKIILFGSYAKGKQVEHRYTGKDGINYEYISDYDF
jgi:hypothetical protein